MQAKTFNRLVIVTMVVAAILPLLVWFLDNLGTSQGMLPHLLGALALMAIPVLWLLGNVLTGFVAFFYRPVINRLFLAQCVVSGLILLGVIYWGISEQFRLNQLDLRNDVLQAIKTRNISKYKQALNACGDVCKNQDNTDSVKYLNQCDEYAYKDWLITAVAAQALPIVDDLLNDKNRPEITLVGSGAPYLSLSYACSGYYVGDANVYQIAVLHKTPTILQRLITKASVDDKSTALWYAAQANKIDYVQRLLAAGANRNIKDEYGVIGVENAGYSLLDAAIKGFAPVT